MIGISGVCSARTKAECWPNASADILGCKTKDAELIRGNKNVLVDFSRNAAGGDSVSMDVVTAVMTISLWRMKNIGWCSPESSGAI